MSAVVGSLRHIDEMDGDWISTEGIQGPHRRTFSVSTGNGQIPRPQLHSPPGESSIRISEINEPFQARMVGDDFDRAKPR